MHFTEKLLSFEASNTRGISHF